MCVFARASEKGRRERKHSHGPLGFLARFVPFLFFPPSREPRKLLEMKLLETAKPKKVRPATFGTPHFSASAARRHPPRPPPEVRGKARSATLRHHSCLAGLQRTRVFGAPFALPGSAEEETKKLGNAARRSRPHPVMATISAGGLPLPRDALRWRATTKRARDGEEGARDPTPVWKKHSETPRAARNDHVSRRQKV